MYGTVFDYYIDHETLAWEHWNKNVTEWNYNPKEPHSSFFIQTTEFIKFEFILNLLIHQGTHVLLLGPKGCGKTSMIKEFVKKSCEKNHVISIQVCRNTKANHIFNSVHQFTEKKTKHEIQPINSKKLMIVLDDVNLKENNDLSLNLFYVIQRKENNHSAIIIPPSIF